MLRAVNHSLAQQARAQWTSRGYVDVQLRGDVAGSMRAGAEFCHRPQVILFPRREAIESHTKETDVQRFRRALRGGFDVRKLDRRGRGDVPTVMRLEEGKCS